LPAASSIRNPWAIVAVSVVVFAALFVALTGMRPGYDAAGWLVWGKQAIHWDLNTSAAPSWKPLTFLFTVPYALFGRAQEPLWMVTAVAVSLSGPIFAGRIAYRLAGRAGSDSRHTVARSIGAVFAGLGVLGLIGYGHLVLISGDDPMVVALCLGAIDFHLSRRYRVAFLLLVLASLGRPEAAPLTLLYAVWAWRMGPVGVPSRAQLVIGIAVIPALWFGVPAITSNDWFSAGNVDITSTEVIPGNKLVRVPNGFWGLYELPMKLAVLFGLVWAVVRRERTWLLLVGAALVWLLAETAIALRGLNASPRFMFEPAAVLIVLAGAAIGQLLALAPRRAIVRWVAIAGVIALVVSLVSPARNRLRLAHNGIVIGRTWGRQLDGLHAVVAKLGAKRILACGEPVSFLGFQPVLAWELGRNVADVGYSPAIFTKMGDPIVLFKPHGSGWQVRPVHASSPACKHVSIDTG
jgi:hypothetical protein